MHFLAPITGLIAAAVVVPLLILLYFLKLKRQEHVVSCTLLWKRAIQDLQVNAPFQRLRRNLLLLLQLLALLAALLALARPKPAMRSGPGERYVLLIDRSASMNTRDIQEPGETGPPRSRLDEVKVLAGAVIDSLRTRTSFSLQDTSDQTMIIAFDRHAKVMCNFTSDKRKLHAALEAIEPSDRTTSLVEAVAVAQAFAQAPVEESQETSNSKGDGSRQAAALEIFSDGRIADLEKLEIDPEKVTFHSIGQSRENAAIVAMEARRLYQKPEQVDVFATLANYGAKAVTCDVQFSIDGNVRAVRPIQIPPRRSAADAGGAGPGMVSVTFKPTHGGSALLEVRLLRSDVLDCDNAAWAVIEPPKKLSVLLVTPGNVALKPALAACDPARLDVQTPAQFDEAEKAGRDGGQEYDVIVLDRHAPGGTLPRGRYLIFGRPPAYLGATAGAQIAKQEIIDWRSRHPVLQFVNLSNLFVWKALRLEVPREAEALAEFADSPALVLLRRPGRVALVVGFNVMDTNWPFEPGFVMFCQNAVSYLGLEVGQRRRGTLKVGQALTVESLAPGASVRVRGPGGQDERMTADEAGTFRLPETDRAGVYRVTADQTKRMFAVNLTDVGESDIAPVRQMELSGRKIEAKSDAERLSNVELWPLLAMVCLVLVCLEWLIYNSKVRL